MKPRSFVFSPAFSSFKASVTGLRPTAESSKSAFKISSPHLPVTPWASALMSVSALPVSTRMPSFFSIWARTSRRTSGSSSSRMSSSSSTTVTFTPSCAAMQASSQPMKPPPSTISVSGSLVISRKARLSTTRSCCGINPGTAEVEPVAMMIFFAPTSVTPSLAVIAIVLRSLKAAVPANCFTPLAVSRCLMPP